jgi:hypothetical protein
MPANMLTVNKRIFLFKLRPVAIESEAAAGRVAPLVKGGFGNIQAALLVLDSR